MDLKPFYKGYELLGDSQMLRFALRFSSIANEGLDPFSTRRIGLCKSGLKVRDLVDLVKQGRLAISPKVIVLIGTNDIYQCSAESVKRSAYLALRASYDRLRNLLAPHCEEVVFLTIPPIPRRECKRYPTYYCRWEAMNRNIGKCVGGMFRSLPLHKEFEDESGNTIVNLFERVMGRGINQRLDAIHLNETGLEKMAEFLQRNL